VLRPYLDRERRDVLSARPADLLALFETLLGEADRAVLNGDFAAWMLASDKTALAPGVDGWVDDDLAFDRHWGFDVSSIDRPVLLLHGDDDRFVPVSHGHWLASRVPGVEARIDPEDGHLTLLERRLREVNDWLLARS